MAAFTQHIQKLSHINSSIWSRRGAFHLISNRLITSLSGQNPRLSSTMARTYESALSRLAELQSNRAITSLFSPPTAAPASPSPPAGSAAPKADLNALAIPEMLAWLRRAGLSQDDLAAKLRCIHVAGTKGKGSVCAYLTALLTRGGSDGVAGKVGTYTSPHLLSVRERIAIDGAPISRDLFARYFFEVWDACTEAARAELAVRRREQEQGEEEKGGRGGGGAGAEISEAELEGPATKPFYFRFLTLVALRAFLGEGVRSAVVECGIGGEYDSTNVLPAASVTTSVVAQLGIDHVGMLGATLPEIAWHKAGVCKAGRACFTRRLRGGVGGDAETAENVMRVLRSRAAEKGAVLVEVEDADVEAWGGVAHGEEEDDGPGRLGGEFQKYNQGLAVLAAREHLRVLASESAGADADSDRGLGDVPSSFTAALRHARLRGRCETREDERAPVTWLVDGAHTAESLAAVASWFASRAAADVSRAVLLFNQQDRDAGTLVAGLAAGIAEHVGASSGRVFAHAVFTRNDLGPRVRDEPARDLSVQRAAAAALRAVSPGTSVSVVDNVADAVAEARALAGRDGDGDGRRTVVLVTGSLHLVGALLRTLEPDAED